MTNLLNSAFLVITINNINLLYLNFFIVLSLNFCLGMVQKVDHLAKLFVLLVFQIKFRGTL